MCVRLCVYVCVIVCVFISPEISSTPNRMTYLNFGRVETIHRSNKLGYSFCHRLCEDPFSSTNNDLTHLLGSYLQTPIGFNLASTHFYTLIR